MVSKQQRSKRGQRSTSSKQVTSPLRLTRSPRADLSPPDQVDRLKYLAQQTTGQSWLPVTVTHLQRQQGNRYVQDLLNPTGELTGPQLKDRAAEGIIQKQDVIDEAGQETTPEGETGENGECQQCYEELKTAFINRAVGAENPQVAEEAFKRFKEDAEGYMGDWQSLKTKYDSSRTQQKASEEKVKTLQREVEQRASDEARQEHQAGLEALQSQQAAKRLEAGEKEKQFLEKKTTLEGMVESAVGQFVELIQMIEVLPDYWASIDLMMATEYAQGKTEPSAALKEKLRIYQQLRDEIETRVKQLDQTYKESLQSYEQAGQALEQAEKEWEQAQSELFELDRQIAEFQKNSLQAKTAELDQELERQEQLTQQFKQVKDEKREHESATHMARFFGLELQEELGIGSSTQDWEILRDKLEQCFEKCP